MPASVDAALEKIKDELVWPGTITLFFRHMNVNGPLPPGTVAKLAASPTHRVRLVSGLAVVFVSRINEAVFVVVPQVPVTSTEYVETLSTVAGSSLIELVGAWYV